MKGRAVFITKVIDGKIDILVRDKIGKSIATLDGSFCKVAIEKYSKTRTLSQNAYYWGVVIPYIKAYLRNGDPTVSDEDAHDLCKLEEVGGLIGHKIRVIEDTTYVIPVIRSTSDLTTIEFEQYLERIRLWAAHQGINIPLPNEEIEQHYIEPAE